MKVAIVVDKSLNPGQKANVSAIIMGQLGRDIQALYTDTIPDASGISHAGITLNVVILQGGSEQLIKLAENAQKSDLTNVVFSSAGQALSNNYPDYRQKITSSSTKNIGIVGIGIYGECEIVNLLTKKFSLAK